MWRYKILQFKQHHPVVSGKILHRASVAHGEVVTWVSCHWVRPVWRYATLCVLSKMFRKLLFNNLSIVWNIKILLITFCQENPQSFKCKSVKLPGRRFVTFHAFFWKNVRRKWAWPIPRDSAQFSEREGFWMSDKVWVISQKPLLLIIAPPSGGNWGRQ